MLQIVYHSRCLQQELMVYGNISYSASEQWRCLQLDLLSMTQEIRESESVKGNISGTLGYNAKVAGFGAEITMPYTNYADHFISDDSTLGIRFILNGNTDTTSNMSANGHMHETVHCFSKEIDVTNESSIGNALENLSDAAKKTITNTGDKHYLCGMYPGYAVYNNLEIKGGAAGGGYYIVQTYELDRKDKNSGTVVLAEDKVNWLVGEEK